MSMLRQIDSEAASGRCRAAAHEGGGKNGVELSPRRCRAAEKSECVRAREKGREGMGEVLAVVGAGAWVQFLPEHHLRA